MKKLVQPEKITKSWYLFDASLTPLGRLATKTAKILLGKHKAIYTPSWDLGDFVVITNAKKVVLTGKKNEQKVYARHSTYPGGLRMESVKRVRERKPEEIVRHAVSGMLPKNRLGKKIIKNLYIFPGEKHNREGVTFVNLGN